MSLKKSIFIAIVLLLSMNAIAQRGGRGGRGNYNRIGLQAGYSIFDIQTDDFITESQGSFQAGFSTRGSYRNNFDLIYGLTFVSNNVGVKANVAGEDIDISNSQTVLYNTIGVQLNLLASYNIIKHNLSIEAGPVLMLNGKMDLEDERFSDLIVDGYNTLRAADLVNVNTINAAALIGVTGGHENVRLNVNYQYGLTNFLGGLNDQGLEFSDFKGNTGTIVFAAVIYL